MDIQDRRLLKETAELARENNKMVKKLYRSMVVGRVVRTVYWVIIIGLAFGSYYFIQPYIEQLLETYQGIRGGIDNIRDVSDQLPFSDVIKDLSGAETAKALGQ